MPSWKGKGKARPRADEGSTAGVVIPLGVVGSGIYDVYVSFPSCPDLSSNTVLCSAYTVPVFIGHNDQPFSLQVDTGSSDLVCFVLGYDRSG